MIGVCCNGIRCYFVVCDLTDTSVVVGSSHYHTCCIKFLTDAVTCLCRRCNDFEFLQNYVFDIYGYIRRLCYATQCVTDGHVLFSGCCKCFFRKTVIADFFCKVSFASFIGCSYFHAGSIKFLAYIIGSFRRLCRYFDTLQSSYRNGDIRKLSHVRTCIRRQILPCLDHSSMRTVIAAESCYVKSSFGKYKVFCRIVFRNNQCIFYCYDRVIVSGRIYSCLYEILNRLFVTCGAKEVISIRSTQVSCFLSFQTADFIVDCCCICIIQSHTCYRIEQRIKCDGYFFTRCDYCLIQILTVYFYGYVFCGNHLILRFSVFFQFYDVTAICQWNIVATVFLCCQCLESAEA